MYFFEQIYWSYTFLNDHILVFSREMKDNAVEKCHSSSNVQRAHVQGHRHDKFTYPLQAMLLPKPMSPKSQKNPRHAIMVEGYKVLLRNLVKYKSNGSIWNEVCVQGILYGVQIMRMRNIQVLETSSKHAVGMLGCCGMDFSHIQSIVNCSNFGDSSIRVCLIN